MSCLAGHYSKKLHYKKIKLICLTLQEYILEQHKYKPLIECIAEENLGFDSGKTFKRFNFERLIKLFFKMFFLKITLEFIVVYSPMNHAKPLTGAFSILLLTYVLK